MNFRYRLLILFCLVGLLINVVLAWWKFADPGAGIAGCGGADDCAGIFSSRWSQVFRIPVAALGVLLYIALYASLLWERPRFAAICYGCIVGAAVWLFFVQVVILGHFCPWCMAAHGVGLVVVVLGLSFHRWDESFMVGLLTGIFTSFGLALGQLYGPAPATHRVDGIPEPVNSVSLPEDIHAFGTGRKVSFNDGKKIYDCDSMPRIGSADAEHVLVEYFDFQCPACHKMRLYLSALVDKHPKDVCVLMLPVPLDHGCNPALPESEPGHPGSCDLTRIALGVWRIRPDAYPLIHQQFMSDPPMDRATALAFAHVQVDRFKLAAAMGDPWIDRLVKANIDDWVTFAGDSKTLPQLLITGKRILHGIPSGQAEFIRVMEQELGL
ncbi:MAG: vitamin K epoxide reductase family protein [Luteolibacter sp.]|uniref:vitamin K epoxide reductase family protein n=1 Tax=Luteolibacter sp. TaxID=1962973 RepID=UPI0032660B19